MLAGFSFLYHILVRLEICPQITLLVLVQSIIWEDSSPNDPSSEMLKSALCDPYWSITKELINMLLA